MWVIESVWITDAGEDDIGSREKGCAQQVTTGHDARDGRVVGINLPTPQGGDDDMCHVQQDDDLNNGDDEVTREEGQGDKDCPTFDQPDRDDVNDMTRD